MNTYHSFFCSYCNINFYYHFSKLIKTELNKKKLYSVCCPSCIKTSKHKLSKPKLIESTKKIIWNNEEKIQIFGYFYQFVCNSDICENRVFSVHESNVNKENDEYNYFYRTYCSNCENFLIEKYDQIHKFRKEPVIIEPILDENFNSKKRKIK